MLQAGACYVCDDNGENCYENFCSALDPTYCPEGNTFFSWSSVRGITGDEGCESNDAIIGRCTLDADRQCSKDASECENPSGYVHIDETCTVQRDKAEDFEYGAFTQYGYCLNRNTQEEFCVWDPADCDANTEDYIPPDPTSTKCDCSVTHTGACKGTRHRWCAINPTACGDNEWEWESALEMRQGRDNGEHSSACMLCSRVNTISPAPSPSPVRNPTYGPFVQGTIDTPTAAPVHSHAYHHHDDKRDKIVLSLAVVLPAVLAIIIFAAARFWAGKKRVEGGGDKLETKEPPASITMEGGDSQNNSMEDDVSIL